MKEGSSRQRVLIVDDSPENIAFIKEALRDQYAVSVALDGATALDIAASESDRPDLILLDIMMPGMNGYQVCQHLKSNEKTQDIPVVFVTAMHEIDDEEKGLRLGAIDYITKPIRPSILCARVRNHMELKQHRDLLEKMAAVDGLTGVANRRRFEETLDSEWKRSIRSNIPLAMLMIDIDFFKNFNDHYGHGAGDKCIKEIAATIATSTHREGDLTARYGGEEFVVLLPETDRDGVVSVAETIRTNIEALNIPHAFSQCSKNVTVSIGAGAMVPRADTSPEALVKAVDEQLYRAKRNGRNRIQIFAK